MAFHPWLRSQKRGTGPMPSTTPSLHPILRIPGRFPFLLPTFPHPCPWPWPPPLKGLRKDASASSQWSSAGLRHTPLTFHPLKASSTPKYNATSLRGSHCILLMCSWRQGLSTSNVNITHTHHPMWKGETMPSVEDGGAEDGVNTVHGPLAGAMRSVN